PLRLQDMESFFLVATDLTGQHTLERQIRQSQKMEAIGTLAGGIAHDFNNILAGMIGFTEMVMEDIAPDSPEHKRLELVLKGGKRGRDLVKQILAFSSQGEQEKKPLAVSEIVEEGLKLLRPTLPSTIEIVSKSLTNDDRIFADLVQMHQVLMNLCTNAAHAMREKGGVLELQISKVGFTEHDPLPFSDMVPGEYVVLTVRDTGTGMTPDILDRIFDPFFTTKKPGEGTGLGLSVIHGIVQRHGGYVAVESEPGKGTTFRVYLPKIEEQAFSEDREAPVATGGNERILFVDDEDMLVELNRQRLTRFGYEVVGTTSSMDALDIFRKDPDVFDLVITDYTMPNLTGMELAAQLLKVKPSIPIILCTGDSQPVTPESAQDAGINALLMKPAGREGLAQTIRNVLDQKTKE
ncbi:MAG TPA: ATP-binding protein, partial [Syntrophorhabdaceae bacterium]|nr:ATP-binding protein [Syntrophorhabdaceae bacterium]